LAWKTFRDVRDGIKAQEVMDVLDGKRPNIQISIDEEYEDNLRLEMIKRKLI
jgi:hypothetical protein